MQTAQIMGRVGRDPEMKTSKAGKEYTTYSVAVNTMQRGEKITTWWTVSTFGKLAEMNYRSVKKGSQVFCSGTFSVGAYEKNDGTIAASPSLACDTFRFIGGGKD